MNAKVVECITGLKFGLHAMKAFEVEADYKKSQFSIDYNVNYRDYSE